MADRDPMEIIASLTADTDTSEDTAPETTEAPVDESVEQVDDTTVDSEGTVEPSQEKLYAGKYKTPEELENAYKHAEQRMHQEAQQRAQYEQYLAQLEAQRNAQPEVDPYSPEPRNLQELIEYTYEDPEEAFWFAATKAPASLPRIVSEIRQFDPAAADKFMIEHQQWQTQTALEKQQELAMQQQQAMQQVQVQAQIPVLQQQAAAAVAEAHQKIASLPNYDVIKEDIANILRERPYLINVESESTLARGLRDAYDLAEARNAQKIQAANAARAGAVGDAGVEQGSFSGNNEAIDEDPIADFRADIFKAANGVKF